MKSAARVVAIESTKAGECANASHLNILGSNDLTCTVVPNAIFKNTRESQASPDNDFQPGN
jgi:hypothetical protein